MKKNHNYIQHPPRLTGGYLMLLALAFGAIFTTILGALVGYTVLRDKAANMAHVRNEALALADGGLARYVWSFTHTPDALFTGDDEVSVEATPSMQCGTTTSVFIRATGTPKNNSGISASVSERLVRQPAIEEPCPEDDSATSTPAVSEWVSTDWHQE
jgi:hypothetical protein